MQTQNKMEGTKMENNIIVYDNGGKTFDRYTAIYKDRPYPMTLNTYECIGMSANPFNPQGFCQHSAAMPGQHLGKRINISELPIDCQKAIQQS
jgi:hypothetical protein